MARRILVLAGDGIGAEVTDSALAVLGALSAGGRRFEISHDLIGGASCDRHGVPVTDDCLKRAKAADAVLLGAVGGPKWESLPFEHRPERGLLALRAAMGAFANLRPAVVFDPLADASSLKVELVRGLDIMIVRELIGGIYFGKPRGISNLKDGGRRGVNTLAYSTDEIRRIGRVAFELARVRGKKLCSVDKANVLESTLLWREEMTALAKDYKDVTLTHMYVDNAAMQLIRAPSQFDVIVTTNMFGDILSDAAAMLTGSLGMLPSASLGAMRDGRRRGLYEPVHGSAPDIAGQGKANPLAMILSVAMMLRWSCDDGDAAAMVERAVALALAGGARTADLLREGDKSWHLVSTREMTEEVVGKLKSVSRG